MKILIANDGLHAHYHERLAWTNAFNSTPGIECAMYDVNSSKAFDIFDMFEPDIYVGQLYNISGATIKCIKERPHLKVALRSGEWNDAAVDTRLNILTITEKEISILEQLNQIKKPDFIYSHYLQHDMERTHSNFVKMGIPVVGIPMSADIHTYGVGVYNHKLHCDIGFVGGYWPYKGLVIDQYLTPLCGPGYNYNIKIFGNQPWTHVNQYYGLLEDSDVANLFKSATICPNLSEPHSQILGIDVNERAFKILAAGGFCIMDNVRAAKEMFPEGVVFAENPGHFKELIDYFINPDNSEERAAIIDKGRTHVFRNHTNYHRASTILNAFNEHSTSENIMEIAYDNHINSF